MNNSEKYELLAQGEKGLASNMAVLPRKAGAVIDIASIEKALSGAKDFELTRFKKREPDEEFELLCDVTVAYEDETFDIEIFIDKSDGLNLNEFGFGHNIDEESMTAALSQPYMLGTSMYFNDNALSSFHLQLKVMNAIVPDASLCVDFMSYRLLAAQWLSMTAKSATPPSPDYLYTIHSVYDDTKDGVRNYWFHTHGLHRCGTVELEMLNISHGAEQMYTLLNMVVTKFLTDATKEKERFMIGYDGMGIDLCWLRWEEAVKDFAPNILGGMDERLEQGNVHSEPSGILFAVSEGNMISPEIYATTLADNPIYYISTEETLRMSALAKERFHLYRKVFEKEGAKPTKKSFLNKLFGAKESEDDKWRFLVKLGLDVDNPQSEGEKEHLWYEVSGIEGNQIEGKLLNQPYWIANLNEGDVRSYPSDLLTDWIIYAPDNTYTTDTIYQLEY